MKIVGSRVLSSILIKNSLFRSEVAIFITLTENIIKLLEGYVVQPT